jgi:hypothetical protein
MVTNRTDMPIAATTSSAYAACRVMPTATAESLMDRGSGFEKFSITGVHDPRGFISLSV